jgi:hypothetical protein
LRLHARHWQKADQAKGIGLVIHYDGLRIKDRCGSSLDGLRIRVAVLLPDERLIVLLVGA